jgi:hypothetical protein
LGLTAIAECKPNTYRDSQSQKPWQCELREACFYLLGDFRKTRRSLLFPGANRPPYWVVYVVVHARKLKSGTVRSMGTSTLGSAPH